MRLHVDDPGHAGLRRAVRATVAVVAALVISMSVVPGTPGVVMASFGVFALVPTADFGGSVRRRVEAYVGCAVVGTMLIVIGVLVARSVIAVIMATLLITAALAYSGLFRGTIASAAPALTIIYIVAVMVSSSVDDLGVMLIGYAIALGVGITVTLLVLPRRTLTPIRHACVVALRALADLQRRRAAREQSDIPALQGAVQGLRDAYLGNPFRSTGLHRADRSLLLLVGQLQTLIVGVIRRGPDLSPPNGLPSSAELTRTSGETLDALADALQTQRGQPSDETLTRLWLGQREEAVALLLDPAQGPTDSRLATVQGAFPERVMGLATIRLTMLVRRILSLPDESHAGESIVIPEPPDFPPWQQVRAQFTLKSPWMRTSLRTGVALAAAAAVVEIVGFAHGFWVLLGALAVLRQDTSETLRKSLAALGGTFIGAIIGGGLLLLIGSDRWVYSVLLVVMAFLAVYAQTTMNFIVAQATFSVYVIIVFSVVSWPPDLGTAAARVEDIAVGAGVSLAVAILLWPQGVLTGLRVNVTDAISSSRRILVGAMEDFIHGPERISQDEISRMHMAMARSLEVVSALMDSHSPQAQRRAQMWAQVLDDVRTVAIIGQLVATWARDAEPVAEAVPQLVDPLTTDTHEVSTSWEDIERILHQGDPDAAPAMHPLTPRVLDALRGVDITSTSVADRIVSAIWEDSWLGVADEAALTSEEPARALA